MNSFLKSTQMKNWIKTEKEINELLKNKVNKIENRINSINNLIEKKNEEKSRGNSLDKDKIQQTIDPKELSEIEENEKIIIINYSKKLIKKLNSGEKKSSSLKCTAISYFRRFYLKKSIIDYDPPFLMIAAVFLGSKVVQVNLTLEKIEVLFSIIKNNEKKVLEYEFYLITILDYNFFVYNPYHALYGLIYNLEKNQFFLGQNTENYINQEDFKQECSDIIDKMFLTDNIFLYSYSEIALASIFIKCFEKNININNVAEKMEIDKIINVKEFLEGPFEKMKKNLELIPHFNSIEEEDKKANELYQTIHYFLKHHPQYQKKLDEERKALKKKMKDFSDDFDELLRTKGLDNKNKNK